MSHRQQSSMARTFTLLRKKRSICRNLDLVILASDKDMAGCTMMNVALINIALYHSKIIV